MAHILVTGATGFIGRHLVAELRAAGHTVRALVRHPERAPALTQAGIELVAGDITDEDALAQAMAGVDGVIHLAARYDFGIDPHEMERINVGGTRAVLDVATRLGRERILYCGSDTSLGDTGGQVCNESKIHDGRPFRSAYEATKYRVHRLVQERMAAGAPIVNAILSTLYGPGDKSAIGDLITRFARGRLPFLLDPGAGYTFTYVADAAVALRLLYEKGLPGTSYLVSGTPATFGQLFDHLSCLSGIEPPRSLSPRLRRWLPRLVPLLAPLLGKSPAALRELLAMAQGATLFYSSDRLCRELGWRPRSLDEGLAETLAWLQAEERANAQRGLRRGRPLLIGLALFDVVLGGTAVLLPSYYIDLLHPEWVVVHPQSPTYWLVRMGMLWLFFAAVEGVAAIRPACWPLLVLIVGVLRLMDVPADLLYFAHADDLGALGRFGLLFAPAFNLCAGLYLLLSGLRGVRAGLSSTAPPPLHGPAPPAASET
jgi:dihydroflavonol-4-reductase